MMAETTVDDKIRRNRKIALNPKNSEIMPPRTGPRAMLTFRTDQEFISDVPRLASDPTYWLGKTR